MKKYVLAGASYRGMRMFGKPIVNEFKDVAETCWNI